MTIRCVNPEFQTVNFYINESLTAINKNIFFETRMFVKSSKYYKFAWCTQGKIFVKQYESSIRCLILMIY